MDCLRRTTSTPFNVEKCQFCQKNVYLMQRIEAAGKIFHKQCLRGSTFVKLILKERRLGLMSHTETELKNENKNKEKVEKGEGIQEKEKELVHLRTEKEQWKVEKETMEAEIAELRRAKEMEAKERKSEKEMYESKVAALRLKVAEEKEKAEKAQEAITQIRLTWGKLHSKYELLEEHVITLTKLKQEKAARKTD